MAVLQQRSGSASSPVFLLRANNTCLGRKPDCEIFLDSDDVSRYHARVFRDGKRYLVEDTQSRNGTQVNGHTIDGPIVLEDGDEITLSSQRFTFLSDEFLFEDSSLYRHDLSAMTFSEDSLSDISSGDPVWGGQGDRIPVEVFGMHPLNAKAVVSRSSVGTAEGGWPTLKQPEHKLTQTLQLQHRLRKSVTRTEVLSSAIAGLFEAFYKAEQIAVILRNSNGNGFVVAAVRCRNGRSKVQISIPLLFRSMESAESILYAGNEHSQPAVESSQDKLTVRYLLASALIDKDGSPRGVIQIRSGHSGRFEPSHTESLAIFSHVISCRLDDAEAADLTLQRRTVEAAHQLCQQLIPVKLPQVAGFAIRHQIMTVPNLAVDLVDCVRLRNGRLGCFILDVPGRGSEAVRLMATIGPVVTRAMMSCDSPAAVLRMVEDEMKTRGSQIPMVTSLCVAILDPKRSSVSLTIAGHCPAYHFNDASVSSLADEALAGPPLGANRDTLSEFELPLADNDVLLLCSDGISRIPFGSGILVSRAEICALLQQADSDDRHALEGRVLSEIQKLQGTSTQQDDIVLLAIHKTNNGVQADAFRPGDTQVPR
jgi:sigma-B regulation protein RsbU (phosphoserine phosphatase)